jgi:hypothetical protein
VQGPLPLFVNASTELRWPAPASGGLICAASAFVWHVGGPGAVVLVGADALVVVVLGEVELDADVDDVADELEESSPPHAANTAPPSTTNAISSPARRTRHSQVGGQTVDARLAAARYLGAWLTPMR